MKAIIFLVSFTYFLLSITHPSEDYFKIVFNIWICGFAVIISIEQFFKHRYDPEEVEEGKLNEADTAGATK